MKKIIYAILICLSLTGCSVSYQLDINNNLSVNERIYFIEKNDKLKTINNDLNTAVKTIASFYMSASNKIEPHFLGGNPNDIVRQSDVINSSVYFEKKYDNIKSLETSLFFSYYFDVSTVTTNKSDITVYASGVNWDNIKKLTTEYTYKFDMETINISIKVPYKVVESNADIIKGNTYIWVIDKDNYNIFKLKLVFDKNASIERIYDVVDKGLGNVLSKLSGNKMDGKEFLRKYKYLILISGILISVIVFLIRFKRKSNKANSI